MVKPELIRDALIAASFADSSELGPALRSASLRLEDQPLKKIIENYIEYYASGPGHTARAKRYDLHHFLLFLAGPGDEMAIHVSDWTLQRTKEFVDSRLSLGEAPSTVARRLATIKHFGRTLAERMPGYINPAREVKTPVLQNLKPAGLSSEEIFLLLSAAKLRSKKKSAFVQLRNQFLLELLLATGLRADEVRLLVVSQISSDFCWLKNVRTKGRKYRNVYIDSSIRSLMTNYLNERERYLHSTFPLLQEANDSELNRLPVFVSAYAASPSNTQSFALSPKTVWRIIAEFGSAARAHSSAELPNLHPHILRHTFAHGLLSSSRDVRLVAQALGHSDVRVTMRYTERSQEEVARAIEESVASRKTSNV